MKSALWFLTILTTFSAHARPLTSPERNCLFEKPVVVGASISAEMGRRIPGYNVFVDILAAAQGRQGNATFGMSPAHLLVANYGAKGFNYEVKSYAQMFTNKVPHLGSSQINALLSGAQRSTFDSASVIIGIDAFYWDAVWNNCGYGEGSGVEATIEALIKEATAKNIRLILGNVPQEDPDQVIINSKKPVIGNIKIPNLWYQPVPNCVASINATLKRSCLSEQGCYLIDIDIIVQKLNRGEKIQDYDVEMNKVGYGLFDIRPDGIHLSPSGSAVVFNSAVDILESHPPACL